MSQIVMGLMIVALASCTAQPLSAPPGIAACQSASEIVVFYSITDQMTTAHILCPDKNGEAINSIQVADMPVLPLYNNDRLYTFNASEYPIAGLPTLSPSVDVFDVSQSSWSPGPFMNEPIALLANTRSLKLSNELVSVCTHGRWLMNEPDLVICYEHLGIDSGHQEWLRVDVQGVPEDLDCTITNIQGTLYLSSCIQLSTNKPDPSRQAFKASIFGGGDKQSQPIAPYPGSPRGQAQMVGHKDNIFMCGGVGNNGMGSKRCDRYDPSTNTWTKVANMKHYWDLFTLVSTQHHIYAIGTKSNGLTSVGVIEEYSESDNVWKVIEFDIGIGAAVMAQAIAIDTTPNGTVDLMQMLRAV